MQANQSCGGEALPQGLPPICVGSAARTKERPLRPRPKSSSAGCGRWQLMGSLAPNLHLYAWMGSRLRQSGYGVGGIGGVCGSGPMGRGITCLWRKTQGTARGSVPERGVRELASACARGAAKGGRQAVPVLGSPPEVFGVRSCTHFRASAAWSLWNMAELTAATRSKPPLRINMDETRITLHCQQRRGLKGSEA